MKWLDTIKKLNPYSQINNLKKELNMVTAPMNPLSLLNKARGNDVSDVRPHSMDYLNYRSTQQPMNNYGLSSLYWLAYESDVLQIVHTSLRREMFRNRYEIQEAEQTDENTTLAEQESVSPSVSHAVHPPQYQYRLI